MRPPLVVGLTGGIGSGKSEALAAFGRHGASVLSSDEVVRELYLRPDVIRAVADHFGREALDADGAVDRTRSPSACSRTPSSAAGWRTSCCR